MKAKRMLSIDDVKLRVELGMGAYRCSMLAEEQNNNVVWAYCYCELYDTYAEGSFD